jgi:hypothetical protein
MENKDNIEKKSSTEVFVNSLGHQGTMTYDPALDNLPMSKTESKKVEEANRRLKLKPLPDFLLKPQPKAD